MVCPLMATEEPGFGFEADTATVASQLARVPSPDRQVSPSKRQTSRELKRPGSGYGAKLCAGCGQSFPLSEFPANSKFCWDDKRALDNISNLAKKQGSEAVTFVSDVRGNERQVRQLLKSYHTAVGTQYGKKRNKTGTWNLVQAMQTLKSDDAWDVIEEGEMMDKTAFLNYKRGKDPSKPVEHSLQEWIMLCEDPNTIKKTIDNQVHCRVVTKNLMNRRGTIARSNQVTIVDQRKKATQEDLSRMTRAIQHGHDEFGGKNVYLESQATALSMNADAFADKATLVGNIQDLMPSAGEGAPSSAGASASSCDGVGGAPAVAGGGAPVDAEEFVDLSRIISVAVRQTIASLDSLQKNFSDMEKKMDTPEMKEAAEAVSRESWREVLVFLNRLQAVRAALADDAVPMAEYVMSCSEKAEVILVTKDGEEEVQEKRVLRLSPPCSNLTSLLTVSQLRKKATEMDFAASEAQLAEMQDNMAQLRGSLVELLGSAKGALAELSKVRRAELTAKRRQPADPAGKRRRSGDGGASPQSKSLKGLKGNDVLFELPGLSSMPIDTGVVGRDLPDFSVDLPRVLKVAAMEAAMKTEAVKAATSELCMSFQVWAKTAVSPRAMLPISRIPVRDTIKAAVLNSLPVGLSSALLTTIPPSHQQVVEPLLLPVLYGMAGNTDFHGFEKECMSSVRYVLQGTRKVVLISLVDLLPFMTEKETSGAVLANPLRTQRAEVFLAKMTTQHMEEFLSRQSCVWFVTLSPGDMLYIPAGFLAAERTMGLNLGVRQGLIFPTSMNPTGKQALQMVANAMVAAGKSPRATNALLEIMESSPDPNTVSPMPAKPPDPSDPSAGGGAGVEEPPDPEHNTPSVPQLALPPASEELGQEESNRGMIEDKKGDGVVEPAVAAKAAPAKPVTGTGAKGTDGVEPGAGVLGLLLRHDAPGPPPQG